MSGGGTNWGSTLIGAGAGGAGGALIGGLAGGPVGTVAGLLAGGTLGGGLGYMLGKKNTNPGPPVYVNGKPTPDDIYDLLRELYYDEELYQKYLDEEALPPDFIIPREIGEYIVQRYCCGSVKSRYHERGHIMCIDSLSLLCTLLPNYEVRLAYLNTIPLVILAVEHYLENNATDEQIRYALDELHKKFGQPPKIFAGETMYREIEYYIVYAIAESIKKFMGREKHVNYSTVLHSILRNHHMNLSMYIESAHDEFFVDETMRKHFKITPEENQAIEVYRSGITSVVRKKTFDEKTGTVKTEEIIETPKKFSRKISEKKI
jgi:hypothetical protein